MRLYAVIRGRVQGVFFRANTKREADRLNLFGTVRNRPDGTVEVVAEGPRDRVNQFLRWLQNGPPRARADRVDTTWEKAAGGVVRFTIAG